MIPIQQTIFEGIGFIGNCHQAAVASLLELELEQVPHFAEQSDWWESFVDFALTHDFAVVVTDEPILGVLGIMNGMSPRGNFRHSVVAEGAYMEHDPHPDLTGVVDADEWWYLIPRDPVSKTIVTTEAVIAEIEYEMEQE